MPGRHERQRISRKKSRARKPVASPMERLVTDSYYNRNRKEQTILADLVPAQRLEVKRVSAFGSAFAAAASKPSAASLSSSSSSDAKQQDEKKVAAKKTLHPTKTEHWTNAPLLKRIEKKRELKRQQKEAEAAQLENGGVAQENVAAAAEQEEEAAAAPQKWKRATRTAEGKAKALQARADEARASAEQLLAGLLG